MSERVIRPVVVAAWALVMFIGAAASTEAQIPAPEDSTGGTFGRRVRNINPDAVVKEMALTVDVATGYDDNMDPGGIAAGGPGTFGGLQSGSVTSGAAGAQFRWGRVRRHVETNGQVYRSYASGGADQLTSGNANVRAETNIGARHGVNADAGISSQPSMLFDAFGPVTQPGDPGVPGATPAQGITEQRFISTSASGGAYRRWSTRQRTDIRFGESHQSPTGPLALEGSSRTASLGHQWLPARWASIQLGYSLNDNRQGVAVDAERTVRSHDFRVAIQVQRRLARTRMWAADLGVGVSRSSTRLVSDPASRDFTVPSAVLSTQLQFSRAWRLEADVARSASVLSGLAAEPTATTAGSLRLNGGIGQRLQLLLGGGIAEGESLLTQANGYKSTSANVQMQWALSRSIAVFASGSHFEHELKGVLVVQPGFPTRFQRSSVRVGVTIWVPVFGIQRL